MKEYKHSALYYGEFRRQLAWRETHIQTKEYGFQHTDKITGEPIKYPHIIPYEIWEEGIYKGIREELANFIQRPGQEITPHDGVHNLLSSWALCANLYFLVQINENFKSLMLRFLQQNISNEIVEIREVELEFAFPVGDSLHPKLLLGELYGSRGKKQTSPDLAFVVTTKAGSGIILTECKYTESHFYACSTQPNKRNPIPNPNPDFSRCLKPKKGYDYISICHQTTEWKRKYMDILDFSPIAEDVLLNALQQVMVTNYSDSRPLPKASRKAAGLTWLFLP